MRYILFFTFAILLSGCAQTDDEKAASLLATINSLYENGKYKETLDSITILRERYPMAIESRRKALAVWQKASLKMAQADVARTDLLLQETTQRLDSATTRLERNRLTLKRDSLKARYDAMCAVVRMIHKRQKQ